MREEKPACAKLEYGFVHCSACPACMSSGSTLHQCLYHGLPRLEKVRKRRRYIGKLHAVGVKRLVWNTPCPHCFQDSFKVLRSSVAAREQRRFALMELRIGKGHCTR